MARKTDPLDAAATAALTLAAERPWREVSLRDIAEAAGLPMTAFYGVARSKDDVVGAVLARFDRAAAEMLELDADASARERVFDAAMARYDAMEAERAGVASILSDAFDGPLGPLGAARLWPRARRTARWLLELAGVDTSGAAGAACVHAFTFVLARTTRAWLADDAGDLSKTMATLDRALRDIEGWGEILAGRRRRGARDTRDDGAEDASEAPASGEANGAGRDAAG